MPNLVLSSRAANSYRRSLKQWMGFVADGQWASSFDCSVVTVLGWLLEDSDRMDDFLSRYRVTERERRRQQVRQVVLTWLAELAA